MRCISVTNNKGGVGKTTTCINIAAGLALQNKRVLVIDTDPQANATFALLGPQSSNGTLYDCLVTNRLSLPELVRKTGEGVDIIPSSIGLSAADITLAGVPGRERLLARKLRALSNYDYILIDTPPSLGILTVNALTCASEVFIPVGIGTFSLLGITLLEDTIEQLKENLELTNLSITGVVATLYDRTRVAKDTQEALAGHFKEILFDTVIPRNKDIEEAHGQSQSVITYAPKSRGAVAYMSLVEEVISRE